MSQRLFFDVGSSGVTPRGGILAAELVESTVLESKRGARILARAFVPPLPRASLVLCHGVCEHQGRYERAVRFLNSVGIACISFDLRGHGRSTGLRGHVDEFEDYLADLDKVTCWKNEQSEKWGLTSPTVLFGHSMGGVIAARYLEENGAKADFSGLILSAPGFIPHLAIPSYKRMLLSLGLRIYPKLRLPTGIDASDISSDLDEQRASRNDPLGFGRVSLRWYTEFTRAARDAIEQASQVAMPVLAFYGMDDRIVAMSGIEQFLARTSSEDKSLLTFPDLRHELLQERLPEREEVVRTMADWIIKRGVKT